MASCAAAVLAIMGLFAAPFVRIGGPTAVALDFCQQIGYGTANDDSATTLEDQSVEIKFLANDACYGSTWTLINVSTLAHGALAPASQSSFTYFPAANWFGTETFTYQWHSNTYNWDSTVGTVTVTVTPVNDPPVAESPFHAGCPDGSITIAEDSGAYDTHSCLYTAADAAWTERGQLVTVSTAVSSPELFSSGPKAYLVGRPGTYEWDYGFTFTPAHNANGTAKLTVTPHDDGGTAHGGIDTGSPVTITINITPVDDPPVAKDDSYSTTYGTALVVPSNKGVLHNDTDVDGPSLTASLKTSPTHGVVSLNSDGSFTYTPMSGYSGSDTFSYDVSDGSLSDTGNVKLTVLAADATAGPTAPAEPSSTATAAPTATGSAQASAGPTASAGASPTSGPTASGEPVAIVTGETPAPTAPPSAPTSGSGSSDLPWLPIIAVVLILVIGSNIALYQVLARRRRDGP